MSAGRNQGDRSSLSSVSIKSFQGSGSGSGSGGGKPHKSLMKCHRSVDPHLRIRPFRSKVTFSEDTKAGDNNNNSSTISLNKSSRHLGSSGAFYLGWDSSNESIIRGSNTSGQDSGFSSQSRDQHHPPHHRRHQQHDRACSPFTETQKRRQSLDPGIVRGTPTPNKTNLPVKAELEAEPENWLHYQSLPNIQEEETVSCAQTPTDQSPPNSSGPTQKNIPELALHFASPEPPNSPTESSHHDSFTDHLSPASFDETSGLRRKSIKRQKSTDLADEDTKMTKLPAPPPLQSLTSGQLPSTSGSKISPTGSRPLLTKKQSSSDSNNSNNSRTVLGILKNGSNNGSNNNNRKQASTESDTGSYHTVNSLLIEKPASNSSSVDSFTSAFDDSSGASGLPQGRQQKLAEAEVKPLKCQVSSFFPTSSPPPPPLPVTAITTSQPSPISTHPLSSGSSSTPSTPKYTSAFAPIIETSLVPKIVFSTSTPSVTSQSSDDQNSPRWDQRYGSFGSSRETIRDTPGLSSKGTKSGNPVPGTANRSSESLIIDIEDDSRIPLRSMSSLASNKK